MSSPAERWDARWAEAGPVGEPDAWLVARSGHLPTSGRALDLAGGTGRHALWLAGRGLDTTLVDVSEVALGIARDEASRRGLHLRTLEADLEAGERPAPGWDVIVLTNFLCRPLLEDLPDLLSPGGVVHFRQATRTNLERHPHPRAEFLLEPGEMAELAGRWPGTEVVDLEEGWEPGPEGTHSARLLARRR